MAADMFTFLRELKEEDVAKAFAERMVDDVEILFAILATSVQSWGEGVKFRKLKIGDVDEM